MPLSAERKAEYFEHMKELMTTYTKCFIVEIDNVGSMQLQQTRMSLRGTAEVLMCKNTMMRKCIREFVEENPDTPIAQLEACCRGNVGFVFTNGDLLRFVSVWKVMSVLLLLRLVPRLPLMLSYPRDLPVVIQVRLLSSRLFKSLPRLLVVRLK